jgi:hypothetical protein
VPAGCARFAPLAPPRRRRDVDRARGTDVPDDAGAKGHVARMMGGDVTVASEPGKGSVFTVRLPGGEHT